MIVIPFKWVPYLLIVLGVFGTIIMVVKGESWNADRIFGLVICLLAAIGGVVWVIIRAKKRR